MRQTSGLRSPDRAIAGGLALLLCPMVLVAQGEASGRPSSSEPFPTERVWTPQDGPSPLLPPASPRSAVVREGRRDADGGPTLWKHLLVGGMLGAPPGFAVGNFLDDQSDCMAIYPPPPSCGRSRYRRPGTVIGAGLGMAAGGLVYLVRRLRAG